MIHPRVTVQFMPPGGTAADAVAAANQVVFIDVTAGTMTAARTNAAGLLVSGPGAGTAIPLDDTRTYQVVVLPSAPGTTPTTGSSATVSGGRLNVTPQIAIKIVNAAGGAVSGLTCTMGIGPANTTVATNRLGWIISNNQGSGALTLTSVTRLLRTSAGSAPTVTLALAPTSVTRGGTGKVTITAPTGTIGFRVTEWTYALSHANPNGTTQTATITRPATEDTANFSSFWEGTMCANGEVRARFVSGLTLRATGGAAVSANVVAMDPQLVTLAVTVAARSLTTPLTQDAETTFTGAINTFHDTGRHRWIPGSPFNVTTTTITSGPNRGCKFADTITGVSFTSRPQINADVDNLSSTFMAAQGSCRVLAPASKRGTIVPATFITVAANGSVTLSNVAGLLAHLGLPATGSVTVTSDTGITPAALKAGVRAHEHTGPISHKQNCLRALRALEPTVFIEKFVDAPGGGSLNFLNLLSNRIQVVVDAAPTHNEVDETATATAGALRFVSGSTLPFVNVDSAGNVRTTWNPTANGPLT